MYFCRTNKAEQYFDIAMDLYFHKGVGATQIIRQIPISRSMLYRWIAKCAEANGLKESTDMSKNTAKGQPQSTDSFCPPVHRCPHRPPVDKVDGSVWADVDDPGR